MWRGVLVRYGATNPRLFGSVARGDARDGSDLDLLVDLDPGAGNELLRVAGIAEELGEVLGVKVDVVSTLIDILAAIERCVSYRDHLDSPEIGSMAYDAVLRNLAVIGEAVKSLPAEFKAERAGVPSHARLRDLVYVLVPDDSECRVVASGRWR